MSVTFHEWSYWYPRVYGYFYKRVNSRYEVEELTSQTLSTVFLAKNVTNFQAYTWKVAHNYLVKYINTKSTEPMLVGWDESIDLINSSTPNWTIQTDIENNLSEHYQAKKNQLMQCIENTIKNPEDKSILEMAIYQEKNSTEISQSTGLKPDNVRKKLSRNLQKLRINCIDLWKHLTAK